jgi:hypothetical protein
MGLFGWPLIISGTNRPVVNRIGAILFFQDVTIMNLYTDVDIWSNSKQALGLTGYLFGWTGFMQNKFIQTPYFLSNKKSIHSSNFKTIF